MEIGAIGALRSPYSLDAVTSIAPVNRRDNEQTERIPDNELAEGTQKKSPLAAWQGQYIDTTA